MIRPLQVSRFTVVYLAVVAATSIANDDWPQFRGPDGQGHARQRGLPTEWSEQKNIAWKAPIAGLGWSSPVVAGGQIWLTTALDEGHSLHAVCVDLNSGEMLHDLEVFHVDEPGTVHSKNSFASPTPVIDEDRIYVHFGDLGTACLTADGNMVWRTSDLVYSHGHGPAGSPVVYDDLLIVNCDGTDVQYVAALDKHTGKIRWKTDRDGAMAYSTPLVIAVGGRDQLISTGGKQAMAYDPATGKEIWHVRYGDGYSNVPRPAFGDGLVFLAAGYDTPWIYAVRPDGHGDVTDTHVEWKVQRGAPLNPSPLVIDDRLYLVDDKGIASCLEAKTGERIWQKRLPGNFSASPLWADGNIYFTNEEGRTTVIRPGDKYTELAINAIDGATLASLAVSGHALLLRSATHLYRIEEAAR